MYFYNSLFSLDVFLNSIYVRHHIVNSFFLFYYYFSSIFLVLLIKGYYILCQLFIHRVVRRKLHFSSIYVYRLLGHHVEPSTSKRHHNCKHKDFMWLGHNLHHEWRIERHYMSRSTREEDLIQRQNAKSKYKHKNT